MEWVEERRDGDRGRMFRRMERGGVETTQLTLPDLAPPDTVFNIHGGYIVPRINT